MSTSIIWSFKEWIDGIITRELLLEERLNIKNSLKEFKSSHEFYKRDKIDQWSSKNC